MTARSFAALIFTGCLWAQPPNGDEFFEKRIRPIFSAKCQACHGAQAKMAGLNLSTSAGFERGSDEGPVVKKGDIEHSRLIEVTSYDGAVKMPPTGKLSAEEFQDLKSWVSMGAPWPAQVELSESQGLAKPKGFTAAQKSFWAFQPVKDSIPPQIRNEAWVKSPIDRFILAKLEAQGIEPAAPASKLSLLRRV